MLWDYGKKIYSQNEEDGILEYILTNIKPKTNIIYEICAGDGIECNSANLIINHNFTGYLFDCNINNINNGVSFYDKNNKLNNAKFILSWITKENINDLILNKTSYYNKEIDILSIDIDGNDYWILKEIMDNKLLNPRIIIVEYQDILGFDKSLTIPYDPNFNAWNYDCYLGPNYCGASLKAFINLLNENYAFIGCEKQGFNGFFIRRDELNDNLKEIIDISICFTSEKVINGMKYRYPRTKNLKWINV